MVPAIWRSIDEIGGPELSRKVLSRVSTLLAEHYRAKIDATEPRERLAQFMRVLEEEGGLVDVVRKEGRVTVSKRNCAFISMYDENRTVCSIELDMMAAIVGRPVKRIACRNDGDPCCSFEVDGDASADGFPAASNGSSVTLAKA